MRVLPPPDGRMSVISALRSCIFSTTVPRIFVVDVDDDGFDTARCALPISSSRNSTRGRLIDSSKPSRRIVSISTPSCKFAAAGDFEAVLVGAFGDA